MKKVYAVYVTDYVSGLLPPARCIVIGLYTKLETAIRSMDYFNEVAEKRLISSGVEYEIKRGAFDGEVVLETYCRSIAEKINQKVYSVIPVLEYLYSINETLKKG